MKNKSPLFIIHYALYILLIISCSTSPQTGSLSGTIHLSGEVEHNDITVALYELAELDPDIVAINEKYPHIGVIINQHTEFDHRFANLIKYTQTDANGNFKIKDIPTGRYNVVAMKDSFGFKYIYEISITEGDNFIKRQKVKGKRKNDEKKSNSDNFTFSILNFTLDSNTSDRNSADITLYPEIYINSDINQPTVFESHNHYIIENDIFISGALTIKPGAIIRLNEGVKLTIFGDLTAVGNEDNFIWFTANDSLFLPFTFNLLPSSPKSDIALYNRIELTGNSDKEMAFCKFDHAGTGLLNNVNGFSISDCIFRNSSCGFKSENVDSTYCKNLLCKGVVAEGEAGVYYYNLNKGFINKNIFIYNFTGLKVKDNTNPEISDNFFFFNEFGAELWRSNSNFINNEMLNNLKDLRICGDTSPTIKFNNFKSDFGIYISYYYGFPNAVPEIHKNNLDNDVCSIYLCRNNSYNIDALNNYFYTINENEIKALIYDKNDVTPSQQQYYGIVDYFPFLTQEYPYAGIQGE